MRAFFGFILIISMSIGFAEEHVMQGNGIHFMPSGQDKMKIIACFGGGCKAPKYMVLKNVPAEHRKAQDKSKKPLVELTHKPDTLTPDTDDSFINFSSAHYQLVEKSVFQEDGFSIKKIFAHIEDKNGNIVLKNETIKLGGLNIVPQVVKSKEKEAGAPIVIKYALPQSQKTKITDSQKSKILKDKDGLEDLDSFFKTSSVSPHNINDGRRDQVNHIDDQSIATNVEAADTLKI